MSDAVFEHKKSRFLELREGFADSYEKTHTTAEALQQPEGTGDIRCAGRIVGMRVMGKLLFAHLYDFSGRIQICVRKSDDGSTAFEDFVRDVAVGDFIGVHGDLFRTKTNELTIRVDNFKLLNKCLRTLPEKFHGLEDTETRYRQRYLDIIMNPQSREVFRKRVAIVKSLRTTLEEQAFLEVETPVLQTQQSGALARPFYTQHNALGIQCVLRIAPETYLKRCIGAGFDRVYEFSRCFRNEGVSPNHLQDFTMVEFYAAYWNSDRGIRFVQEMFRKLINDVFGAVKVTVGGHEIDFSGEWPVYSYVDIIKKYSGIDVDEVRCRETLVAELKAKQIFIEDLDKLDWAAIVDALYKKVARPLLIQPCFLVRYPAEMSPLARRNAADPRYVDQFQFLVAGVELVKAYSELVDPLDQRQRFEDQMKARERGDDEAMPLDEDFLLAMEHGFPPICGVGIGIDRLVQILCGCENIKDTVLFPLMRPSF
jgi:lysyl-tRNA synthetase class 2